MPAGCVVPACGVPVGVVPAGECKVPACEVPAGEGEMPVGPSQTAITQRLLIHGSYVLHRHIGLNVMHRGENIPSLVV